MNIIYNIIYNLFLFLFIGLIYFFLDEHPAILLKTVKDSSITRNNSGNNAHDGVIVSETLPLFQKTRTTTTV